jgi:hypothetical protein
MKDHDKWFKEFEAATHLVDALKFLVGRMSTNDDSNPLDVEYLVAALEEHAKARPDAWL